MATTSLAQASQDFGSMSIEDLMKVQVTTASRSKQLLGDVPAAIFVLTQDQIRSSGLKTVPEMLRLVPGVQVSQIDGNKWQISIRGFGGRYSNKLQVLIDGRSIYTPLYSGVVWEGNLVAVDEIDRIEVIRGPGGAIWGANAINGIVNIITKVASSADGTSAHIGSGVGDVASAGGSTSMSLGSGLSVRVLAEYNKFAATDRTSGQRNFDGWENLTSSLRTDWQKGRESATLSGRLSLGAMRQITPVPTWNAPYRSESQDPFRRNDWSLTGHWSRENADGGTTDLHVSTTQVDDETPELGIRTSVLDLGAQQTRVSNDTKTTYGLSFRNYSDRLAATPLIAFTPNRKSVNTYGGFAQIDHRVNDSLRVTAGATVERNEYSGWEFQPNVRALWGEGDKQTVWVSASRAVRTPSRADHDVRLLAETRENNGLPVLITLNGNPNFESESLIAFEVGTRLRSSSSTFVDPTAFFNIYDNLRTFEAGTPYMEMNPTPHFISPYFFANNLKAQTAGIEAIVTHEPDPLTRLDLAASLFTERFTLKAGSTDPYGTRAGERQGNTPRYQINVSAQRQIASGLTGSLNFMYRGGLDDPGIASYERVDARLAWSPTDSLELSLIGRNLFGKVHQEAPATLFEAPSRIGRSMEVQARWRF